MTHIYWADIPANKTDWINNETDWSIPSNWYLNLIPNGSSISADLRGSGSSFEIINLSENITLNYLYLSVPDYCKLLTLQTEKLTNVKLVFVKLEDKAVVNDLKLLANPEILNLPASGALISSIDVKWENNFSN